MTVQNLKFVIWKPWWDSGLKHGFSVCPQNYGQDQLSHWSNTLCGVFGASKLIIAKQVHGAICAELGPAQLTRMTAGLNIIGECDAIMLSGSALQKERAIIGVKSADCVPILIRAETAFCVVHAGWRGIAAGITEGVIAQLRKRYGNRIEVLLGPCAGPRRYEVGAEVLSAIGPGAVSEQVEQGRYLLDLRATLGQRILASCGINCATNSDCTISQPEFHSHRRDGERAGRNLNFIVVNPEL